MAENSSNRDTSVDGDDIEHYLEGEEIPDAFLESLEALEENGSEFDLELINAISEVNKILIEFEAINDMILLSKDI